jgi:hypothetical protein
MYADGWWEELNISSAVTVFARRNHLHYAADIAYLRSAVVVEKAESTGVFNDW